MAARIRLVARSWSVFAVESDELDRIGVASANRVAMEGAVAGLGAPVSALLIDARVIEHGAPQVGLIKGDRHSLSIACAAILAKVHRDAIMVEQCSRHPAYRFSRHKGYGTPVHLAALRDHGPCPLHRQSFRMPGTL